MDVISCIKGRRSIRAFTEQPVPPEVLKELINLGTFAATASGRQPWGFVVIEDKGEMKRLSDWARDHWLANLDLHPYMKQYQNLMTKENYNMFYNAPCLLLIYGDSRAHFHAIDCTLAANNIMLAAREFGLGTCWIGNAEIVINTAEFKADYGVPEHYQGVASLIIGYPKAAVPAGKRKPAVIFKCR